MKLTGKQIWEAIISDPRFEEELPEGSPQREAIKPFIEGSVVALAEQLDTTVSLQSIISAKSCFLHYCVDNGLGKTMGEVIGIGGGMIDDMLNNLISTLELMLDNISKFLEENGNNEEEIMNGSQIGMNDGNRIKWSEGVLTIGQLLLSQPSVILKNDS